MKKILSKVLVIGALTLVGTSCSNDFLDRKPLDQVEPGQFYKTADQLKSFIMSQYEAFTSFNQSYSAGLATLDNGTDNQAQKGSPNRRLFSQDNWKVPSDGGLGVNTIRDINYFIQKVEVNMKEQTIIGPQEVIKQALGEAYFFRAYQYFDRLKTYGDFPIITEPLPADNKILVEQSKRQPRNEVARFILKDLDKAIELLPAAVVRNQRLTKRAAHLFRSRVALYEGTFEKYHAGSGRVPGDASWPGKDKEWNKGKIFNSANEVTYFLTEAMKDAKLVADATELTPNTEVTNPTTEPHGWNPYFEMFGIQNPSVYPEVIFWKEYNRTAAVVHHTSQRMSTGTATGWTRGLVESFLTKDGKPYYAVSNRSDATIKEVKEGRDGRLQLFLFGEGDVMSMNKKPSVLFQNASLLATDETQESTGYRQRKGKNYDPENLLGGVRDDSGHVLFRGAEAYLNYIEASYLLTGNLTAEAKAYWEKLRVRAGIKAGSIDETIAATDMSKEADVNRASYDWAAFSGGTSINDATLYSIRRERRCELAGEGFRMDDLIRWRAMDQVKNYQLEGVNFWDKIHEYEYFKRKDKDGKDILVADASKKANMSSKEIEGKHVKYVHPYQIVKQNNDMWDGYTFYQAHYLSPISIIELQLCSPTNDKDNSNLYQNPGWSTTANEHAKN